MSNDSGDYARGPEGDLKISYTEFWRDRDFFFSFIISSEQAVVLKIPVWLLLLAARSRQCSQTFHAGFGVSKSLSQLETVMALSLGSGSSPSASVTAICFRISTRSPSLISW
jgi:hypothetical protein